MAVHGTHFFEEMDSDDTAAAGEDDSAGHVGVQPPPVPAPGASGMTNKTAATAVATSASPAAAAPAAVPPAAPAAAPVHTAAATATGSPTTTASAHVDTSSVQRVNVMDQILPWLWLGSVFAANNKQLLEEHGITHVVNMAGNVRCKFKKTLTYFHAKDLRDDPTVDLFVPVGDAVEFMLRARDAGHRVLVHWYALWLHCLHYCRALGGDGACVLGVLTQHATASGVFWSLGVTMLVSRTRVLPQSSWCLSQCEHCCGFPNGNQRHEPGACAGTGPDQAPKGQSQPWFPFATQGDGEGAGSCARKQHAVAPSHRGASQP